MSRFSITPEDLSYELDPARIATAPVTPRDSAKLMVISRRSGDIIHRRVSDLPRLLDAGDVLVTNDTSVIPARLLGVRRPTGGRVQGLYLATSEPGIWEVMLRSNSTLREGQVIDLLGPDGETSKTSLTLKTRRDGHWLAVIDDPERRDDLGVLEVYGRTPLPPYILARRGPEEFDDHDDRQWYQTVYADPEAAGSVAAPTAGLHVTSDLLRELRGCGVTSTHVTLHVGAGTFKPVTTPSLEEHHMHSEAWSVTAEALNEISACSGRVIAVGTTSVRVLESLPDPLPTQACSSVTDLLIAPPWTFRHVDALMTNFHLPRSTLLALVAAAMGTALMHKAYREAMDEGYRFYSYGDAMLILP